MAATTGFVQRVTWLQSGPTVCIWIGDAPASAALFFIQIRPADGDPDIAFKRTMAAVLVQAGVTGRQVVVGHLETSGEITTVELAAGDVSVNPLQLDAMEITQGIQHLSLSVPLIAGKRTVVRLYLSHYSMAGITVRGQIAVRQGPSDALLMINSLNTVTLAPADAGSVPPKRNDVTRSLNFLLPDSRTTEGPLIITVASITDVTTGMQVPLGGELRPTLWFHDSPPLRVHVLTMS